jgi:hypothetical protein
MVRSRPRRLRGASPQPRRPALPQRKQPHASHLASDSAARCHVCRHGLYSSTAGCAFCVGTRPSYSTMAPGLSCRPCWKARRDHMRPCCEHSRLFGTDGTPAHIPAIPADWADCFSPIFSPKQRRPVVGPRRRPTRPPSFDTERHPLTRTLSAVLPGSA